MQFILRIASIIGIIISTIKIGIANLLTPGWIAFIIICAILLLAGGRRVVIVVASIASLALFVRLYGNGSPQGMVLLQSIFMLVIVCYGLYIMFRGFFRSSNKRN